MYEPYITLCHKPVFMEQVHSALKQLRALSCDFRVFLRSRALMSNRGYCFAAGQCRGHVQPDKSPWYAWCRRRPLPHTLPHCCAFGFRVHAQHLMTSDTMMTLLHILITPCCLCSTYPLYNCAVLQTAVRQPMAMVVAHPQCLRLWKVS